MAGKCLEDGKLVECIIVTGARLARPEGGGGGGIKVRFDGAFSSRNLRRQADRLRDLFDDIVEEADKLRCKLPAVGGGFGANAFAGVGGGVSGSIQFDPKTGQIAVSGSLRIGVGLGAGVKGKVSTRGFGNGKSGLGEGGLSGSGGIALNAQGGNVSIGTSTPLVGSGANGSLAKRTTGKLGFVGVGASVTGFGSVTGTTPKVLECLN